jgi:hypothetical protein
MGKQMEEAEDRWKSEIARYQFSTDRALRIVKFALIGVFAAVIVVAIGALFSIVHARPSPEMIAEWDDIFPPASGGMPDNVRSWFRGVRAPSGVPCCDISDGHRTAYDIRSDGYWVPIGGAWQHVPEEAVVHNAGNPVGEAVVWYVRQGEGTYYIRCFVPGGGV